MRALFVCVLLVAAIALCAADKPDLKELKKEANRKKACTQDCANVKYAPICAGKKGEKPKSFGSLCVMNNHNCENKDTLEKISNGECPGGGGVRLS